MGHCPNINYFSGIMINLIKSENFALESERLAPESTRQGNGLLNGSSFFDILTRSIGSDMKKSGEMHTNNSQDTGKIEKEASEAPREIRNGYQPEKNETARTDDLKNQDLDRESQTAIDVNSGINHGRKNKDNGIDTFKGDSDKKSSSMKISDLKKAKATEESLLKAGLDKENKIHHDENKLHHVNKSMANASSRNRDKTDRESKKNSEQDTDLVMRGLNQIIDLIKQLTANGKKDGESDTLLRNMKGRLSDSRDNFRNGDPAKNIREMKQFLDSIDLKGTGDKSSLGNSLVSLKETIAGLMNKYSGRKNSIENDSADKLKIQRSDAADSKPDFMQMKLNDMSKNESLRNFGSGYNENQGSGSISMKSTASPSLHGNGNADKNILFREQLQTIIDNSRVTVRDSRNATFSVKLNPKELGNINVNIGLEHGVLSGKFLVDSAESKELLLQNLVYIKQQLEESGISVGEFQVNINNNRDMQQFEKKESHLFSQADDMETVVSEKYEANLKPYQYNEINLLI